MNNHIKKLARIFLLLVTVSSSLLLLASCQEADTQSPKSPQPPSSQNLPEKKLTVVTSFYPLAEFSGKVGGDAVEVSNIVPAGAEPHDYEPTPQDIAKINTADIFIYNGAGFESWVDAVKANLNKKNQTLIEMVQHVELITAEEEEELDEEEHGPSDPHIWLDPINAQKEVMIIRDTLVKADPNNAPVYTQNSARYLQELADLDQKIAKGLQNCQSRDLVTSHAAFAYFAKHYNLNQISISGLSPEEEPSAKKLGEISDLAKASNIQYIFYETLVSPKIAETLAREIGAQTAVLNPIEGLTDEEVIAGKSYITVMEENLRALRMGLNCT